ncbi:hypothetical protein GTZ97_07385 [Aquabacterium fontiphilum]|uniref:hypothetical protein n=1 Tax=Aquabacterium fontiphilum TaxID=450365 RepID=UPI001378976F|nr:hypothetical protein [Aquabacterium fontiphilum]NBD20489.1 hypothetical protein [Aquabacterium fontiphilum]
MQTILIVRNSRPSMGRFRAAGQMGSHPGLGACDSNRLFATIIDTTVEQTQAVLHEDRSKPGKGVVDTR